MITEPFVETADIETSSDDYAQRFAGAVGAWFLNVQEKATLDMLAAYPGATVLDVGGGHGQLTEALIRNGYDLTVLGSAEVCRRRIQPFVDQGLCRFIVGDVLNLPFASQSFDVVISYRLLPHVTHWKTYLAEMARVARNAVLIDYPEVRSINYLRPYLFRYKKRLEGNTRPYSCFRMENLLAVLDREGFTYGAQYRQFFLPMVLHRKLGNAAVSAAAERVCRALGLTRRWGSPVLLKLVRAERGRL